MKEKLYLVALHYIWITHKKFFYIFEENDNYETWKYALKDVYLEYKRFFESISYSILKKISFSDKQIEIILDKKLKVDLDYLKIILEKRDVKIITIHDENYPNSLREIHNPPYLFYLRWIIDNSPKISIVWSRNITSYWYSVISKIIPELSKYFIIVSWWAIWCDSEAHEVCLKSNWKTISVLWTGIDIDYPVWNKKLFDKIVDTWGWVISIFPLNELWSIYSFPVRNEIVAWLSLWTLIIEAKEKSWTLITANLSLDLWRDLFVVPGDIYKANSKWCNNLLKSGSAKLVSCASDILEEYNIWKTAFSNKNKNVAKINFADSIEKMILEYLFLESLTTDEIIKKSKLDLKTVTFKLSMMEIEWIIKKGLWGKYEII